jgi:hypothetical protein
MEKEPIDPNQLIARPIPRTEGTFGGCYLSGTLNHSETTDIMEREEYKNFCFKLQKLMEEHQVFRLDIFVNPYRRDLLQSESLQSEGS